MLLHSFGGLTSDQGCWGLLEIHNVSSNEKDNSTKVLKANQRTKATSKKINPKIEVDCDNLRKNGLAFPSDYPIIQ